MEGPSPDSNDISQTQIDSDRTTKKRIRQESQNGETHCEEVIQNSPSQRPKKIDYKSQCSMTQPSPTILQNSNALTACSNTAEDDIANQILFDVPADELNDVLSLTSGTVESQSQNDSEDSNPTVSENLHLDKEALKKIWDGWFELEKKENRRRARIQVEFDSIVDDALIFKQEFSDQKKAKEFQKDADSLLGRNVNLTLHLDIPQSNGNSKPKRAKCKFEGHFEDAELDESGNLIFYLKISKPKNLKKPIPLHELKPDSVWKISEISLSFYPLMRKNLKKLCDDDNKWKMIVELKGPTFKQDDVWSKIEKFSQGLNEDQKQALIMCLNANDYSLIHGLPGSGKTHVIVRLLRILIEEGQKILLSSFTHFAIDNILERFVKDYPEFQDRIARIASDSEKVSPKLQGLICPKDFLYAKSVQIVAMTCLSASTLDPEGCNFDTCIIDEASQALMPIVLGPLLLAKKFILVGDHHQLQPIVKSKQARKEGMCISLFEQLASKHETTISKLTIQYRMNQEIMSFSNQLVYDEKMSCGSEEVKNGRLALSDLNQERWLKEALNSDNPVVFLDVGKASSSLKKSRIDCKLTSHLAEKLGLGFEDVRILTPRRRDVVKIKKRLTVKENFEVSTIDSCQGLDKRCIIISFSLEEPERHEILEDERRVNVAFTRAKHKLIMVGSMKKLLKREKIKEYMELLKKNNQVIVVSKEDLEALHQEGQE